MWGADTAWDQDLSVQILKDSWNTICAKAIRASSYIQYKRGKSSENWENITQLYIYKFHNLAFFHFPLFHIF